MLRLYDSVKQFIGKSGVPLVGGRVYVYLNGTDDLASLYADPDGVTAISNPMVLDSDGRSLGCFVEQGRLYRIKVNDASDALQWTVYPVSPLGGTGGGSSGHVTELVSSDGTVEITESTVGNRTVYDLSTDIQDSTDLLNWIRCDGANHIDGTDTWKPTYTDGTMVVGNKGIMLSADQYYHVTAHVRATKTSAAPYYDDIFLLYKLDDGATVTPVTRQTIIVDCSMGLSQDFEFSTDVKADTDCELLLDIIGQEQAGISFEVLNMELHRVYSGAPHLPAGIGRSEQSDWTETDDLKMSYIRHKPDLSLYVTDTELDTILEGYATTTALNTGLATKQDVIDDLATIRSGAAAGATAVQPATLNDYATTSAMNTALAGKQDTLTAGTNVSITNNIISATDTTYSAGTGLDLTGTTFSVDTTTIATKSDLSAYTPTASLGAVALSNDYDDLSNKPAIPVLPQTKDLVAGSNISITESSSTVTIAATAAPQLQANWNESDSSSVQYIQNKPTIPVLPSTKDLVAGNNISITENANDVTVACAITVGTVTI